MTAPVSAAAIDAFKDGWLATEGYRDDKIEGGIIAALPLLRADLVAEALAPIRAALESDRRDVAAWLIREADQRVQLFPQRRDGIDALMRHLATVLLAAPIQAAEDEDCTSCGEVAGPDCAKSQRACGHHCNHSWDQDLCHWCGVAFGESGLETPAVQAVEEHRMMPGSHERMNGPECVCGKWSWPCPLAAEEVGGRG